MQPYKKQIKGYLIGGVLCFYLGMILGNSYHFSDGYDVYSKLYFLLTKGFSENLATHTLSIFLIPSLPGVITGGLFFFLVLLFYVRDNDRGVYRLGEEHGSARYAKQSEIDKFKDSDPQNDIILTQHARMGLINDRLPIPVQKNKNILALGGPGSGKTYTFIKPNIMQANCSFLTTDTKGLLPHELGGLLEEKGYQIKVFNIDTLTNTDTFNVFSYIKTELDIDRVLEAITEGTKKSDQSGEDFWRQAEALLIRSFIAFLWFDGQDNDYLPHLGMVADMLRFTERKDPKVPSPVEEWFEEQNEIRPNNYAYKQWTLFNDLYKSETRMSVLAIAAGRYSVFDHVEVVDMIKRDSMDIESWLTTKTAVFVTIPDTNDSYNFIVSIMIATVMETLRKRIDNVLRGNVILPEGVTLEHFRFFLDEFFSIGKIPNVDKALSTFRSREMSLVLVLQALDQLKTMYPKGWATLVNTCDTLLFLGGDEEQTTEYLSKRSGKQTISIRKHSHSKGRNGGGSENRDSLGRSLLMADEVGKINGEEALVFISGEQVYRDKKFSVPQHPNADKIANSYKDDNWYRFKRYKTDEEEILDKISPENIIDHGDVA